MPNWNYTALKCGNPEVIKACASALKNSDRNGCNGWKEGDTELYAETENDVPDKKIQKISKEYADAAIACWYGYECDNILEIHIVKYYAGRKSVVIERNCKRDCVPITFDYIPLHNIKDRDAIYEKAAAFHRRFDTIKKKDGELFIEMFMEEVRYTFEHDGADGKKYRVEATKNGPQIFFKVFEGLVKYDWREVIPYVPF